MLKLLKYIINLEIIGVQTIITFFGIKIKFRNKKYYLETNKSIAMQNEFDLCCFKKATKFIVFLVPSRTKMTGGVMSIFHTCLETKKLLNDYEVLLSTHAGKETYAYNDTFENAEKVYRWKQVIKILSNAEEVIMHIPEYYSSQFYQDLSFRDRMVVGRIPVLRINIMNQNIDLMPSPKKLQLLYRLTGSITQTVAHKRYATQEVYKKWGMPIHYLPASFGDYSIYRYRKFEEKEKVIVISPDISEHKGKIVQKIRREMPAFEIVTVKNLTFKQYMDLISKAYFSISFGEGFDGYYLLPVIVGSLGFSVYNDTFFPDNTWKKHRNVYSNYNNMYENIVKDMKCFLSNQQLYERNVLIIKASHDKIYNASLFRSNLMNYYNFCLEN